MRPKDSRRGQELYECHACGERVEDPETRACTVCGDELVSISRPRDL